MLSQGLVAVNERWPSHLHEVVVLRARKPKDLRLTSKLT